MYNGDGTGGNPYSAVVLGVEEKSAIIYVYVIELDVITTIAMAPLKATHFFVGVDELVPFKFYEYMKKSGIIINWLESDHVKLVEI